MSVMAELVRGRREARWPIHVEPVGIVRLEVADRVALREAVDLEVRRRFELVFRGGVRRRLAGLARYRLRRRARDRDPEERDRANQSSPHGASQSPTLHSLVVVWVGGGGG